MSHRNRQYGGRIVLHDMAAQIKHFSMDEFIKSGNWWMIIYLLVFFPFIMHAFDEVYTTVSCYGVVLGVVVAILVGRLCPMQLPKMMYLCPMGEQERRQYIASAYWIKVGVTTAFIAIVNIILVVIGYYSWYGALYVVYAIFMIALGNNMLWSGVAYQNTNKRNLPEGENLQGYQLWVIVQQMASVMYAVFLCVVCGNGMCTEFWEGIVFMAIMPGIVLLLTVKLLTYWKRVIKTVSSYECMYGSDGTKRVKL